MPRGPAPTWNRKLPHTIEAQPYIRAAYQVGYEQPLRWTGIETHERARTLKAGLFNAAKLHRPRVSVSVEIVKEGSTWTIVFTLHDKKVGRAYVVATYGSDRRQWPFDMRERG